VIDATQEALRRRRDRHLSAFVAIATSMTGAARAADVLNRIASEARFAAGLDACAVTLVDSRSRVMIAGTAGLPDAYAELLEACRRRGAPLVTLRAIDEASVIVDPDWRRDMLSDDRWRPLHRLVRTFELGTLIAAPLRTPVALEGIAPLRGALTGFLSEGSELDDEDRVFLQAMADHAAIAISYSRLFRRVRTQAAAEERWKLARDLHDSVTQEMFAISLRTKSIAEGVAARGDDELAGELTRMHEQVRAALADMRTLILEGRVVDLGERGLVESLRSRALALSSVQGPEIRVEADGAYAQLEAELQEDLYMIVVEGIRNAVKHADASTIIVTVQRRAGEDETLEVIIEDDGRGIDPARRPSSAVGLDVMRERATAQGGRLEIGSPTVGGGTRLLITIPGVLTEEPA
jgi:signal transduction histidine kinase